MKEIYFTNNIEDIFDSDVFIVTVPTPIDEQKKPNLNPLKSYSETIVNASKALINPNKFFKKKNIIFESTVYPGATEEICIPIIEEITNLRRNIDFDMDIVLKE